MPTKRTPGVEAFAWQFAQACLADSSIPEPFKGMIRDHSTITSEHDCVVSAQMLVLVLGAPCQVKINFQIRRMSDSEPWSIATAILHMVDKPDDKWKFSAQVVNNKLKVTRTEKPDDPIIRAISARNRRALEQSPIPPFGAT